MQIKKRWIASVVDTAGKSNKPLPWERGARRTEMIMRRKQETESKRSA